MIKEINDVNLMTNLLTDFKQNVGNDTNPFLKYIGYYDNNKIIGIIIYEYIYDRIEIDYIVVDSKYRRKGIASKLLEYVISLDSANITLEVNVDNFSAINLYKKYGFEEVSIRKNYYGNNDAYLMIRR